MGTQAASAAGGDHLLYVTHDQEEALTMSDRIAVMSEGRVIQVGMPEDIYDRPNSPFMARFIGETNLIIGEVIELGIETSSVRIVHQVIEAQTNQVDSVSG